MILLLPVKKSIQKTIKIEINEKNNDSNDTFTSVVTYVQSFSNWASKSEFSTIFRR